MISNLSNDSRLLQAKTAWFVAAATHKLVVPKVSIFVTDKDMFCPGIGGLLAFSDIIKGERWIFMNVGWRHWSDTMVYEVFLHELGHLWKPKWIHSRDPRDVMYDTVDGRKIRLTENDVNWLR